MKGTRCIQVLVFIGFMLFEWLAYAQPIKLKAAHNFPPGSVVPQTLVTYTERVQKQTGGKVEITVYGPGLIKPEEFVDATVAGITDMAYGTINLDLARFALDTALNLPGLGWGDPYPKVVEKKMRVYDELRKRFPVLQEKQKDIVVLYEVYHPPFVFHSPKKEVRVPSDMKGMRVAATGWFINLAKVLGAAPVTIPAPERYMALQRGVVDGSFDVYPGMYAMKLYEVTNNYLEVDFGDSIGVVVMNRKKFESLPPDVRKAFIENRSFATNYAAEGMLKERAMCVEEIRKRGQRIITPTAEELREWEKAFELLYTEWAKDIEGRGLPAKAFLEELRRLLKSHE